MSGSFNDLYAKIYHDENPIVLEEDIELKRLERFERKFKNGIKVKDKYLTIDGNGYSIDAKSHARIFNVIGGNIILKNITFKNAKTKQHGAAIRNNKGKINLINCSFMDNLSKKEGSDISNGPNSTLILENCQFSQNNNKHSIWNLGKIMTLEDNELYIKSITNNSYIDTIKEETNTQLSIVDLDTDKLPGQKHRITVKLTDEEGKALKAQAIRFKNDYDAITDEKGEVIFEYRSDNPGSVELPITYAGYDNLNYNKAHDIYCQLNTVDNGQSLSQRELNDANRDKKVIEEQIKSYKQLAPFEAYDGDDDFVFISYAHIDAKEVYSDIDNWNQKGQNIWYDNGIAASKEWSEVLQNKIEQCSVFVVFLSGNSVESIHVRNEVLFALDENKPCIPIFMENIELKYGLGLRLAGIHGIFKSEHDSEEFIQQCYNAVENLKRFQINHG